MRRWEMILQERDEQDRLRILDYREVELEFRAWMIELMYEEVKELEPSEHSTDDDPVHDDWICDWEQLGTVQSEIACPESDYTDAERTEDSPEGEPEEIDIYESFYKELDNYKCQQKVKPRRRHYRK